MYHYCYGKWQIYKDIRLSQWDWSDYVGNSLKRYDHFRAPLLTYWIERCLCWILQQNVKLTVSLGLSSVSDIFVVRQNPLKLSSNLNYYFAIMREGEVTSNIFSFLMQNHELMRGIKGVMWGHWNPFGVWPLGLIWSLVLMYSPLLKESALRHWFCWHSDKSLKHKCLTPAPKFK